MFNQLPLRSTKTFLFAASLFVFHPSLSVAAAPCGQASAVPGSICPHLKVKVNLDGCPLHQEKKKWTVTARCVGQKADFRHSTKGFEFSGQLVSTDSGWETPSWSKIQVQYTRLARNTASDPAVAPSVEAAVAAPTPTPVATPVAPAPTDSPVAVASGSSQNPSPLPTSTPLPAPVTTSLAPAQISPPPAMMQITPSLSETSPPAAIPSLHWKTNGFLEVKYRGVQGAEGSNRQAESGFLVDDAALYIEGKAEGARLFLDLPFSRDRQAAGFNPDFGKSDSADFGFAKTKAQAYIEIPTGDNGLFQFGQFDTIYGFELNDAKDRFFSQTGLVYNNALPVTHTGALWQYTQEGLSLKLLVANPNNKGSLGTSTTQEDGLETGATLGWSDPNFRLLVGYLSRPKANPLGEMKSRTLKNLVAGVSVGGFDLDLEHDAIFDPSKDNNGNLISDAEGTAAMLHLVYNVNGQWKLGIRSEKTHKDVLSGGNYEEQAQFLGLQYRKTEQLSFGAEYGTYETISTENADRLKSSLASASVRFQF